MKRFRNAVLSAAAIGTLLISVMASEYLFKDDFWNDAARGGIAEVEFARIALERSQNESVRDFAQHMIDDHTKANEELKSLAAQKNVTLPTEMDAKHQTMAKKLRGESGDEFDRDYIRSQVKDHEMIVKLFTNASTGAADADVKAWAAKMLPTLREHLESARSLDSRLGGRSGREMSPGNSDRGGNMNHGNMNDRDMNDRGNMNSRDNTDRRDNMNTQNTNSRDNTNSRSRSNSNVNSRMNSNANSMRDTNNNSMDNTNGNVNSNSNRQPNQGRRSNANTNSNVNQ